MPQQIEVPGMGVVEFPDGMSDAQIAAAIKKSMPQQSVMDKLTGTNGPRYQTWPEKAVRGLVGSVKDAAALPGDVYTGKTQMEQPTISDDPNSPDFVGNAGPSGKVLNDAVIPRALNLATMATPVNPAVRAGDRAIPGASGAAMEKVKPKVPSTEQLKAAGAADIQAAENSGLEVTASSVGDWSRKIQSDLFKKGIHPVDAPNTFAKLKELENAPAGSFATASNLQSLRQSLGKTAQNFNPNAGSDQLAATNAIKGLDEFIPSLAEKDVLAGTPAATSELFKRGRGNYAAAMRSNELTGNLDRANTGILERAQVRAQAANSGGNLDNTIRQKVASLLEKPKEVSGFSDKEIEALGGVAAGGKTRNTARYVGNLLGGGGGVGQSLIGLGGATGGGVAGALTGSPTMTAIGVGAGVAPAIVGSGSKAVANALAKRSLRKVDELVRTRSPLYEEALKAADSMPSHLGKKATIAKMLLMEALQGKQ